VEGEYIKEKEENPVSKCSHVLILWLNLERTKFNKMFYTMRIPVSMVRAI
jgi:hypothetical protein